MGYIAKLIHGADFLDLNSTPFSLAPGWAPPGVNSAVQMTSGTMANSFAGGELVGEKLSDRNMSIPVQIKSTGASTTQTHAAVSRIDSFLRRSLSDKSEKTFFVFSPSDAIPYTPKYGQLFYKYEIKANLSGNLSEQLYSVASINAHYLELNLTLKIAPTAVGERQLVGSATGGVLEDTRGTADGSSRGLLIPRGVKNQMTNPVFGHGTPLNGVTVAASLIATTTTDKRFAIFGKNAAKITRVASAAYGFYQSIDLDTDAATHVLSAYFIKEDGSAVTSADVLLRYDIELATTFLHMGNGLYKATAAFTSGVGAKNTGFNVQAVGVTLYCAGWQVEEKTFASPLCTGDMLDCVWDSTAHASESTRTVARWKIPATTICDIAEWSAIITMRANQAHTTYAADTYILTNGAGSFYLFWDQSDNRFSFYDGTNTINGSGSTIADGDLIQLAIVAEQGSLKIYKNGAQIATGSTYTPPTLNADFYLGSSPTPASHFGATYMGFVTFSKGLTAAQVLAYYTDTQPHYAGGDGKGQVMHPVPWLWTDDGDNIIDNCYDSTHENFSVVGGVPGTYDAITMIKYTYSSAATAKYINQVRIKHGEYLSPEYFCYFDLSGTADAAACGGEVQRTAPLTSVLSAIGSGLITESGYRIIRGMPIQGYIFRTKDTSATTIEVRLLFSVYLSGYLGLVTTPTNISTSTAFDMQVLKGPSVPDASDIIPELDISDIYLVSLYAARPGAASANLDVDYLYLAYDRLMKFGDHEGSAVLPVGYYSSERKSNIQAASTGGMDNISSVTGQTVEMTPNRLNMIMILSGDIGEVGAITDTFTIAEFYVTPRWALV